MKPIELYKYINDNNIEWHCHNNDVIIFPLYCQIEEFGKLLSSSVYDDGIDCTLQDGYIAIFMKDICEYHGIELSDVFDKSNDC